MSAEPRGNNFAFMTQPSDSVPVESSKWQEKGGCGRKLPGAVILIATRSFQHRSSSLGPLSMNVNEQQILLAILEGALCMSEQSLYL